MPRISYFVVLGAAMLLSTYAAQSERDNCRWTIIGYHCEPVMVSSAPAL